MPRAPRGRGPGSKQEREVPQRERGPWPLAPKRTSGGCFSRALACTSPPLFCQLFVLSFLPVNKNKTTTINLPLRQPQPLSCFETWPFSSEVFPPVFLLFLFQKKKCFFRCFFSTPTHPRLACSRPLVILPYTPHAIHLYFASSFNSPPPSFQKKTKNLFPPVCKKTFSTIWSKGKKEEKRLFLSVCLCLSLSFFRAASEPPTREQKPWVDEERFSKSLRFLFLIFSNVDFLKCWDDHWLVARVNPFCVETIKNDKKTQP